MGYNAEIKIQISVLSYSAIRNGLNQLKLSWQNFLSGVYQTYLVPHYNRQIHSLFTKYIVEKLDVQIQFGSLLRELGLILFKCGLSLQWQVLVGFAFSQVKMLHNTIIKRKITAAKQKQSGMLVKKCKSEK